jgi:hypothetical protein
MDFLLTCQAEISSVPGMARTREASVDTLEQMADATAASLAQAAASSAYQLFSDGEFRRLARFERLSQAEHDRIFNELVIAFLVLIMLLLEAPDLRVADHIHEYLTGLNKKISKAYLDQLRALGIESKHLADWEKLIGMRYEEYARDKHEVRAAAMQIESSKKRLDWMGFQRSNCWCRFKQLRLAATSMCVAMTAKGGTSCSK